jgi:guanylate kinase
VIIVLSGPGGVGKGTVVRRLLELEPELWLSRSWTTRERRPGEPEDAYVFVDREAFMARVAAHGFVEWTDVPGNGQLYGTPTIDAPPDRDTLLEIELDGARQIKERYPDALLVLIVAPSQEEQRARLRQRGDDPHAIERRVQVGADEEARGRAMADHVVINDDVDRAAAEVAAILARHRNSS